MTPQARSPLAHRDAALSRLAARLIAAGIVCGLVVVFVAGCVGMAENAIQHVAPPECPDGRAFTEWCGCLPPLQGDDC